MARHLPEAVETEQIAHEIAARHGRRRTASAESGHQTIHQTFDALLMLAEEPLGFPAPRNVCAEKVWGSVMIASDISSSLSGEPIISSRAPRTDVQRVQKPDKKRPRCKHLTEPRDLLHILLTSTATTGFPAVLLTSDVSFLSLLVTSAYRLTSSLGTLHSLTFFAPSHRSRMPRFPGIT